MSNLTGTMRMCVAARGKLGRCRGALNREYGIDAPPISGGPRSFLAYTASKGGVAQLTKGLGRRLGPRGAIRVNAIAPGWISTEMTRGLVEDEDRSAAIIDRTPMQRWGRNRTTLGGGPVVFLCSAAARFITGAILPVDGRLRSRMKEEGP